MIIRLLIAIFVVLLTSMVVPGIHVSGFFAALLVAVVLGIINMTLKPLLVILTLPVTILTLGLFIFVINGLLLWLVASLVPGFAVDGFVPAFLGALVISLIHFIIHRLEKKAL